MNKSFLGKIVSAAVVSLGAIAVSLPAQAGNIVNGWNYASDASNDGSGGSQYEIYGIGVKQVNNEIWVGINAGMPLTGVANNGAADKNIGWGDLFLDFNYGQSGNSFASAQGALLGIRFAGTNDSIASTTGVYTGVSGTAVASSNHGYNNLNHYTTYYPSATIGDLGLAKNNPYYAAYAGAAVPNVIGGYNSRAGDVTALLASDLTTLTGSASNKFGFKFAVPTGYNGSFLGSLFLECINDSVAIQGNYRAVPVPPAIAGIIAAGAFGGWRAAKRKKQLKAVEA